MKSRHVASKKHRQNRAKPHAHAVSQADACRAFFSESLDVRHWSRLRLVINSRARVRSTASPL